MTTHPAEPSKTATAASHQRTRFCGDGLVIDANTRRLRPPTDAERRDILAAAMEQAQRWARMPAVAKARRYLETANIDEPGELFAYELTRRERIEAANALATLAAAEALESIAASLAAIASGGDG
jgi:hypothetical protein